MPMFFLYTFLVLSFLVSSVSQTFCATKEERKGAPLDFEGFARLYLSLTEGPRAIGSQKPEVAETILSLMPLVRGHAHFTKGFQSLVSAKDLDSVGYMRMVRGLVGDKITDGVLKLDAQITARFADFLFQSLEGILRIHAQVKNKAGEDCVGAMNEGLSNLLQEINEASNRTAADIMTALAFGWQSEDPRWSIGVKTLFSRSIRYSGSLTSESVQRKLAFLELLGEDKRAFGQLASDAGQAEFYALCGDNVMAVHCFEELMFYQKINAALSACVTRSPLEEMVMRTGEVMGGNVPKLLELFGEQTPSLSSGRRFVIDQIRNQTLRKLILPNTSFIEGLLNPLVEFVAKEALQIKAERTAQKKKEKKRKKNAKEKAKKALEKAAQEQESSGAAASVSSERIDESRSNVEESDLAQEQEQEQEQESSGAAASVSSAVMKDDEEDEDSDEESGFNLAAALHFQKGHKRQVASTVADMGGAASSVSSKEISFPRSTFSEVVLEHERGTVNTLDFREFLAHVRGSIEKPRNNGMTYYTLPNVNGTGNILYHVHLPHADKDPFYRAILHHFIRPSVADAGFTAEMFG